MQKLFFSAIDDNHDDDDEEKKDDNNKDDDDDDEQPGQDWYNDVDDSKARKWKLRPKRRKTGPRPVKVEVD